jgi:hypothetical protein
MRVAYEIGDWSEFAVAHVGASAALLGLVFVGLTINLRDVVASRLLVNRAAEAVILLGSVLATSTAVLIPGQARGALSAELIVLGAALLAAVYLLQRGAGEVVSTDGHEGPRARPSSSAASSGSAPPCLWSSPRSRSPRRPEKGSTGGRPLSSRRTPGLSGMHGSC